MLIAAKIEYKNSCVRLDCILKIEDVLRQQRTLIISCQLASNLLDRQFTIDSLNTVYVSDITYIRTREGWLYLATVLDLYSRKIVGWAMSDRMEAILVEKALLMAIWNRKPARDYTLMHHSDRGS